MSGMRCDSSRDAWNASAQIRSHVVERSIAGSETFVLAVFGLLCWDEFMRISQKLEYAFRAMAQLAKRHDGKSLVRLDELARREAVPSGFLVQILSDLKKAGLVDSRRGASGGYVIGRDPGTILLSHVVEAVEPALLNGRVAPDGESGAGVAQAWQRVSDTWRQSLDEVSLEEMCQEQGGEMFYI